MHWPISFSRFLNELFGLEQASRNRKHTLFAGLVFHNTTIKIPLKLVSEHHHHLIRFHRLVIIGCSEV